ncbi:MAG TPA: phosphoribosyltransferase family protein [Bryobacteraceae bacterium]|nr:phosphoribosyltransferase family protein [Bryobacteraceae bacterium]
MKPDLPYRSRADAGRYLAQELAQYKYRSDVFVLGITRGGVPVAAEVARALQVPMDVVVVRKLGAPFQPDLGMGAIAPDDVEVLDQALIRGFGLAKPNVDAVIAEERAELERRERRYRAGRPPLDLKNYTAILVDDGLAAGSTMLAAVEFARKHFAKRIVMAVPIGSHEAVEKLRDKVDVCICLARPEPFFAVGEWYWNFLPVSDAEVIRALEDSSKAVESPMHA